MGLDVEGDDAGEADVAALEDGGADGGDDALDVVGDVVAFGLLAAQLALLWRRGFAGIVLDEEACVHFAEKLVRTDALIPLLKPPNNTRTLPTRTSS